MRRLVVLAACFGALWCAPGAFAANWCGSGETTVDRPDLVELHVLGSHAVQAAFDLRQQTEGGERASLDPGWQAGPADQLQHVDRPAQPLGVVVAQAIACVVLLLALAAIFTPTILRERREP